jgi:hypothetical protein
MRQRPALDVVSERELKQMPIVATDKGAQEFLLSSGDETWILMSNL